MPPTVKMKIPTKKDKFITYRSLKNFDESNYSQDLDFAPFHVSEIFDSVNDSYWFCSKLITNVIDEHAPVKSRKIKGKHVPYMNDELRKAINVRNMLK